MKMQAQEMNGNQALNHRVVMRKIRASARSGRLLILLLLL
jgi:hypothetical protein